MKNRRMSEPTPHFCAQCGGALEPRLVAAEQRMRRVCSVCGAVAYSNPKVLVTTIVASDERILLCRRASPPAAGCWVLPGGFMESGETMEEAAARETLEETGVVLDPTQLLLYGIGNLPHISEIYVGFVAAVSGPVNLHSTAECTEVSFFAERDLPWADLAYPDIGVYLREYFTERRTGAHMFHYGTIENARVVSRAYRIADIEETSRTKTPPGSDAQQAKD
jgi:ADP-ribose pyrophosphatase YjhB (NUDIX family)